MSDLILVSNRLPWTVQNMDGRATLAASSGGLATALAGTHAKGDTLWVGWPGDLRGLDTQAQEDVLGQLRQRRFAPVVLEPLEVERYYEGFSNGVLWPHFHYLLDKVKLDMDGDWDAYVSVNQRFADRVAELASLGARVWVHDYQLTLVPGMLRALRPDLRIGFFLHIPFPAHEVFRILPFGVELLQGLLSCDLVGFHTRAYREHFAACAAQMLGAEVGNKFLEYEGRKVRLGEYAIGIDAEAFSQAASRPGVRARVVQIRAELGDRKLILGIDRLDYTKGIPRRLLAFERYLERHPEMCEKVRFIQVAVSSRQNVDAYSLFRKNVDEVVARINGRFGSPTHMPLYFLHQGIPFEEIVALYGAADLLLVTPLRDGMNLVAKEFCAARNDEKGVLVLSELAGAALEMKEALQINPYDLGAVAKAIEQGLAMDERDISRRMRALRRQVFQKNVHVWAARFMADLNDARESSEASALSYLVDRLLEEGAKAEKLVLMLDYDGTLVPFADSPEKAIPDVELLALLDRLAKCPKVRLNLVSGRSRQSLEAWFGKMSMGLYAEHGFWRKASDQGLWMSAWESSQTWMEDVHGLIRDWTKRFPGTELEQKGSGLAFHYRQAQPALDGRHLKFLQKEASALLARHGLELLEGSQVLEFRMKGVQKGMAIDHSLDEDGTLVVAIGDDRTDEDMFRALPPSGIAIRVGQGPSCAGHRLPSWYSVRILLEALAHTFDKDGFPVEA